MIEIRENYVTFIVVVVFSRSEFTSKKKPKKASSSQVAETSAEGSHVEMYRICDKKKCDKKQRKINVYIGSNCAEALTILRKGKFKLLVDKKNVKKRRRSKVVEVRLTMDDMIYETKKRRKRNRNKSIRDSEK